MAEHNHFEHEKKKLKFLLVTVSTTRNIETDTTGDRASEIAESFDFECDRAIVKDDESDILSILENNLDKIDCYVFMGGTGLSKYDLTVQVIRKIAEKEVTGFGELFRMKSNNTFAYLSNASMFVYRKKLIFCLPGSPNAQETGFSVINDLVYHAFHEVNRQ